MRKCIACGSKAVILGSVMDKSSGGGLEFCPEDVSTVKKIFGVGLKPIQAYACTHCGHLQFAVEFSAKDLEKYQSFEGEQPTILERLNRKPKG